MKNHIEKEVKTLNKDLPRWKQIPEHINLNDKNELLSYFEEPKIENYSDKEILHRWNKFRSKLGIFELEGAIITDDFLLFIKEIARGEYPEEKADLFFIESDRIQEKLSVLTKYGLTVEDIYVGIK